MGLFLQDVFSYPYDNDLLLRKQKTIKRKLLESKGERRIAKRIAILGGSTVDDIKNILELFLLNNGIAPVFYQSEYNKFYEDAVFANDELDSFSPEIILVFTSMVNIVNMPEITDDSKEANEKVSLEFRRYKQIWDSLSAKYDAVIIQNNMDIPYANSVGSLSSVIPQGINSYIRKLNAMFAEYSETNRQFYVHDLNGLSARLGGEKWHNRSQYYAYKFAMDYDVFPDVAWGIAKIILSILGKGKKCLVLDLDNTLWGGVIGDDGISNISIGRETPLAESYTEFQQYVKSLKNRGIILAVCSKNDELIAKSGFDHPDSVLKLADFISFKANWQPKDVNIREIAMELNIGTDSMVFIDDNPVERALVRNSLPEVAVPEVDPNDVYSYIKAIEGAGYFEAVAISADDMKRNESYAKNKERAVLLEQAKDYGEFLKSLSMKAEIMPFQSVYYDRISQLTNKTNQFNLTTKRYTVADIESIANSVNHIAIYGRLEDKFGDNGLVSVVIGEVCDDILNIDLWIMSCRVLKRGMEYAMLDSLVKLAKNNGINKIVGKYIPTKKNGMVANLYGDFGFVMQSNDDGISIWEMQLDEYVRKDFCISVSGEKE